MGGCTSASASIEGEHGTTQGLEAVEAVGVGGGAGQLHGLGGGAARGAAPQVARQQRSLRLPSAPAERGRPQSDPMAQQRPRLCRAEGRRRPRRQLGRSRSRADRGAHLPPRDPTAPYYTHTIPLTTSLTTSLTTLTTPLLTPPKARTFRFELLLTPCRPADPAARWRDRHFQARLCMIIYTYMHAATPKLARAIYIHIYGMHMPYPYAACPCHPEPSPSTFTLTRWATPTAGSSRPPPSPPRVPRSSTYTKESTAGSHHISTPRCTPSPPRGWEAMSRGHTRWDCAPSSTTRCVHTHTHAHLHTDTHVIICIRSICACVHVREG